MKINLVSLIDPALDIDLMPFWISHYQKALLDRYIVFIHHKPGLNDCQCDQAEVMLESAGWEHRRARWGSDRLLTSLQRSTIDSVRATMGPDDIVVAPDSDEFHNIADYRRHSETLHEASLLAGVFEDRWDSTLHCAVPGIPLEIQYPLRGDIYEAAACRYARSNDPNWKTYINRTKAIAFKNKMVIDTGGTHVPPGMLDTLHEKPVLVRHYSWRRGFVGRMLAKGYHPLWFIAALLQMFGVSEDSPEWACLKRALESRQKERGWIPTPPNFPAVATVKDASPLLCAA